MAPLKALCAGSLLSAVFACQPAPGSPADAATTADAGTHAGTDGGAGGGADSGCVSGSDAGAFPVKVVFLLDQQMAMCVVDPPGSQFGQGFCEQPAVQAVVPSGVTQPERVRAVLNALPGLAAANVQVALVPYETAVELSNVWPVPAGGPGFARPDATLDQVLSNLVPQLGQFSNLEGALHYTVQMILADAAQAKLANPTAASHTRYVVVLLSDGLPLPRCTSSAACAAGGASSPDAGCASPSQPDGIWADTDVLIWVLNQLDGGLDMGPFELCKLPTDGGSLPPYLQIAGFTPGGDLDQNDALFAEADALARIPALYGVGEVTLDTRLVFGESFAQGCGPACQDLFAGMSGADARSVGAWTLQQLAIHGGGSYRDMGDAPAGDLSDIDFSPLPVCAP